MKIKLTKVKKMIEEFKKGLPPTRMGDAVRDDISRRLEDLINKEKHS